jgi:hypothetical protein
MAVTAHYYESFGNAILKKTVNVTSDTLQVLLIASGTYTWNSSAVNDVHVSDFLAGSGAGTMTEVSVVGTNYSRKTLATVSVSQTYSAPNAYTTLVVSANPTWSAATFSASYAVFFDNTVGGSDSTNQMICYWDFGGTQVVTSGTPFVLNLAALNSVSQALVQWQNS